MTVTTIDPQTALVVIDLQAGIVAIPGLAHPTDDIVARSVELTRAFRERGLPVVLVNVDGVPPGRTDAPRRALDFPAGFADLIPELDAQPTDILVTKRSKGAFATTDLEAQLRDRGVTQIVVTGIATASGVESTVRDAHEHGFHVTVVSDAVTDRELAAHDHSIETIFPKIAEVGTTADVIAALPAA
ncbi:MAG: isochorismatase family protein [Patulibacter sp.]|nr:isochorismatase family protein [Patulibacter sp.]